MPTRDDNLIRFVRRVHRRLVLVRAAERAGACVGVASVFACLFAVVAMLQGRQAMQLVLPILGIGAVIGLMWGLTRRPTRFDAVVEADRQLQLSDLLATAYSQRRTDDPWQLAVVAVADARCRTLSPAAVVVHRYGGRAWGGIGLAAATGLTLALLSGVPRDSRARPAEVRGAVATNTDERRAREKASTPEPAESPVRTARPSEPETRSAMGAESPATDDAGDGKAGSEFTRRGNDAAGGDGAGQTASSQGDPLPRASAAAGNTAVDDTATPAGGGIAGMMARDGNDAEAASGTRASSPSGAKPAPPPWTTSSWPADRAAAAQALQSGRVPDAYRDVVQEYFTHDEPNGR